MLVELPNVKQEGGIKRRRWFQGEGMELILWYDGAGTPEGFQLCYVAPDRKERALTWRPGRGFTHEEVQGGGTRPDKNMSPILVRDGVVPWALVRGEFERHSAGLEPAVRDYVSEVLCRREE
jgi:hypothetical protein